MNENTTKLLAALGLAHMSVMAIEAEYGKKYKNEIKLAMQGLTNTCMLEIEKNGDRENAEPALNESVDELLMTLKAMRKSKKK